MSLATLAIKDYLRRLKGLKKLMKNFTRKQFLQQNFRKKLKVPHYEFPHIF